MLQFFLILIAVVTAGILIRVWTGALNIQQLEEESLASVEKRHPYLPGMGAIGASIIITSALFVFSLLFGTSTSLESFTGTAALLRTFIVFVAVLAFGVFDQWKWHGRKDRHKYFYAFVLGTLVTWILIAFKRAFFETGVGQDPFLMALGITCVVVGWRFLFGSWNSTIKATVLGTFIFWVCYAILRFKTPEELLATAIAACIAIIPVVIWCKLFLSYHKERFGVVLLALFAGMLSTAPILFYSELMKRGIEFNFFLFKITPVSFGVSSQDFVSQSVFSQATGSLSIVLVTLVTYAVVGIIEEVSKYWVLRHSSKEFFRSIDDTLQLAIVVAMGFAFAENIVNPTYFVSFVQEYLIESPSPQWGALFSSIFGRGVLTMMVHILSTGVLGYYFGLAFFASPLLRAQFEKGKTHPIAFGIHRMLNLRTEAVYARTQMALGLFFAIVLHGLFDFIVTLPEVLPGNPATVGALLSLPAGSPFHFVSITMVPALLYVVGGFWLLTTLFQREEDMKEFGAVLETQTFVS